MGLCFTLALTAMASIREIIGNGSWLGITIVPESIDRFTLMTSAPGGFFTFGLLMAVVVWIETMTNNKVERKLCCDMDAKEENK